MDYSTDAMKSMNIGFIGLGLMGTHMAANILKAGFRLTVYNRSVQKTEKLKESGAAVAGSPRKLADVSDVIITMVTASPDVEDVLFGRHGVVATEHKGITVIDMSTIGPTAAKSIEKKLSQGGIGFLDAPVTGGTYGAESAELTIFAGGREDVFERMKPVFRAMGNNIHYMGATGSGQAIKMINNFLIASSLVSVSEGMMLADKMGLPRGKAAEVLETTPAVSLAVVRKLQNYVTKKYPMNFTIKNMLKDLTLAGAEAGHSRKFAVLSHVRDIYRKAAAEGLSESDYSRIIDAIEGIT